MSAAGEALAHYETARRIMAAGPPPQFEAAVCQHLYTCLGRTLELTAQFERAGAVYQEMEDRARQHAAPALKLAALMAQVTLRAIVSPLFDPVRGEALAEQALSLARDLGDPAAEAKILWGLSNLYIHSSRLPQAIACGEQALALARDLNLEEQKAFILNDLGLYYALSGHLDRAREALRETSSLWRKLNNLPMLADSLARFANLSVAAGDYNQALAFADEACQISLATANLWGQSYSKLAIGYVYWERGQPDQAIAVMEECLRLGEAANYLTPQVLTQADLAAVYGSLGALEQGLEIARQALTVAETYLPLFRPYVLAKLAQLHVWQGNLSEAEIAADLGKMDPKRDVILLHFQFIILTDAELALKQRAYEGALTTTDDLLAILNQFDLRAHLPEALYLRGQILMAMGQTEAAHETLLEAQAKAEAVGSRRMLWQILFVLSQLETDPATAERLHRQAVEIVEYIAGHISDPELRASFLGLPQVQQTGSVSII
jgi:tetratricopeptide (TPR) repeat protein